MIGTINVLSNSYNLITLQNLREKLACEFHFLFFLAISQYWSIYESIYKNIYKKNEQVVHKNQTAPMVTTTELEIKINHRTKSACPTDKGIWSLHIKIYS